MERYNSVGDDGRETNKAISKLIGAEPVENGDIENDYMQYCSSLGLDAPSMIGIYKSQFLIME